MWHRVISLLTTVVMSLHACLGCCWHHAHAQCAAGHEQHSAEVHGSCCGHHGHHHHGLAETAIAAEESGADALAIAQHSDDAHLGCDEGNCKFLATSPYKVPKPDAGLVLAGDLDLADQTAKFFFASLRADKGRGNHLLASDTGPRVQVLTQSWLL